MRATGVKMQLAGPSAVTAECCVDSDALARKFALPENVSCQEWCAPDRSAEDPPASSASCATCLSKVWVLHATERRPDAPTFPSST